MTRINLFRTAPASVAWGKTQIVRNVFDIGSPFVFAAALIACSLAVGCSSEKPQSPTSTVQPPTQQSTPQLATTASTPPATVPEATPKPTHRRVVRKAPATVNYGDKDTGISFQYPRSYALKTGDAVKELFSSDPTPMDFTQPGGVPVAAVTLPGSAYPNSDLTNAYFQVSMNKTLTADQCNQFSVPQPDPAKPSDTTIQATAQVSTPPISKLLIGDMELQSTQTSTSADSEKGLRENSSKYFHVFENGACYEFALKVSTTKSDPEQTADSDMKAVHRDEIFHRLEKILATVKINPVTPEVNAEMKTNQLPSASPAQ
jgi:hypothetical protein